ncbi:MAG: phospholipase D-like domain-containing protein, partial [Candidatus Korarchaeum sp.]|nr:phospholipase D-like domain-containing protein [Candidatus Korarchaeum sp.]
MRTYVGRNLGAFLELMIFSASRSIWVCSSKISPRFAQRLVDNARKGIDIKVITESYRNEESVDLIKKALRSERSDRSSGTIKEDFTRPQLDYLILKSGKESIQVSIYIIDGKQAMIGSANLTESDLYGGIEYMLIIEDLRDVEKVMEDFIA